MKQNIYDIVERLRLLPINEAESLSRFSNEHEEYNVFLHEEAQNYENLNISRTHLLVDTKDDRILAYMSLQQCLVNR